jgi:hypothetical protein
MLHRACLVDYRFLGEGGDSKLVRQDTSETSARRGRIRDTGGDRIRVKEKRGGGQQSPTLLNNDKNEEDKRVGESEDSSVGVVGADYAAVQALDLRLQSPRLRNIGSAF